MTFLRLFVACSAIAAGAIACTSSSGGSSGDTSSSSSTGGDSGPTVSCATDPRVDTYVANLTKASASGKMKVTIVTSDPAPPSKGSNVWKVKVTDGAGAPMTGALTVAGFMPDHGHPSTATPQFANEPDGSITISNIYLFMPGVWRITITSGAESVEFFFCVAG